MVAPVQGRGVPQLSKGRFDGETSWLGFRAWVLRLKGLREAPTVNNMCSKMFSLQGGKCHVCPSSFVTSSSAH